MPGRTPAEAIRRFVDPLQLCLSCVSRAVLRFEHSTPDKPLCTLMLGNGDPVPLGRQSGMRLSVIMHFRVVEAEGERGPFKIRTEAYYYSIQNKRGQEILAYHWHPGAPNTITFPHLHLGQAATVGHAKVRDSHLPTGRIAFEDVISLVIEQLGVAPLRQDHRTILETAQRAFVRWRTWG